MTGALPHAARPMPTFPAGFTWGVATSAYQIEGAAAEDGRGPSVWDTFAHTPGTIADASTGDVACDHYHRAPEDVGLMAGLGVGAYRCSISWPRVMPAGAGPVNRAGLAFYDRLLDLLLERGIAPLVTLHHWDLPQPLQEAGGWTNRDTAERFAHYADVLASELGDRVRQWITVNEPSVVVELGHHQGIFAPGATVWPELFPVVHHQLLGHGLAAAALRAHGTTPVVLANAYSPAWAVGPDGTGASATDADRAAAAAYHALHNQLYTDPLLLGRYPEEAALLTAGKLDDTVRDGDLAVIAAPLDGLGVNYYNPTGVCAPDAQAQLPYGFREITGYPRTAFDWPVAPDGLREMLVELHTGYGELLPPIWITENGCAVDDHPDADGAVDDAFRVDFLDGHVRAVHAAVTAGVEVAGYCVWSLLDNWEWAQGFSKRFGLVHVDFATQRRTPKRSWHWYRDLIRHQR